MTLRKRDVDGVRNVRGTMNGGNFRNRTTIDVEETDWWSRNVNVNVGDVSGV